jgi:hypothetical protein
MLQAIARQVLSQRLNNLKTCLLTRHFAVLLVTEPLGKFFVRCRRLLQRESENAK